MVVLAGLAFSLALILASYAINRWLSDNRLRVDRYQLALTASAVLLLATLAESMINPAYELWQGRKLWQYHVAPLHRGNVSALAVLIWTAYGVHLYFTRQSMEIRLSPRFNHN